MAAGKRRSLWLIAAGYLAVALFFRADGRIGGRIAWAITDSGRAFGFFLLEGLGIWLSLSFWNAIIRDPHHSGTWPLALTTHTFLFYFSAVVTDPPYIFEVHALLFHYVLSIIAFAVLRALYYAGKKAPPGG